MNSTNTPLELTPKHVRAARALLAWSQQDLAKAAGVAVSTIADFERGKRTPVANNSLAIREALENADIRFLPTGAIVGPAVPGMAASQRAGMPVRWVSAEDLSNWANRTDGVASLPTLLAHLIRATLGTSVQLRFPSDEGIRHPGWDGRTSTEAESSYIPHGEARWEIGAQRNNIGQKAEDDYRKRTTDPGLIDPATAAYVFVTPRHWPKKDDWAKAHQDEGTWREVRAYDADDLVHWIEQTPAVGLWLATRLGNRPLGIRELDQMWDEWSRATRWPLTEDLVLSDRDQDAAEVLRWLRSSPSVLSIQATNADEVAAFFHATLAELPDDVAASYRVRSLVATTTSAARTLAAAPAPLILLLTDPEPGLAQSLVQRGHYVLQAYDEGQLPRGEVRTLARPTRDGIAGALIAAGIPEPRAWRLARESGRNLAILRRLIAGAPDRVPTWAKEAPPNALLAALVAGGWDENTKADQARIAEIADQSYETIIAALTPYVGDFDSPLRKIGSTWRIASAEDAWLLLAHNLTTTHISRFEAAAHAILGSSDPRFDIDPNERWMAPVRGIHREYSGMLRHGIGQTLILLALWGDRIRTVPEAGRRADAVVSRLLRNADERRWWSLSRDFRLLAEASPDGFLSAIEDSLDMDDPTIGALFGQDDDGIFGTEHLSDLMWALESLAWSPDWMPRVTHVLARLDAIDTKPRRYSNGPSNSLREIHLLWIPQTYATLDQRLRALDLIRKREANTAWKLMLGVLPRGHDSSTPSPMPRWRDFTVDSIETVTWALIRRGAEAISERLLTDADLYPKRWLDLLDRLGDLAPGPEEALERLEAAEPRIDNDTDRLTLWKKLRGTLHHHRSFPDTDWSLPESVLHRLESVYHRFAPEDPLERVAWIFEQSVQLPNPSANGWEGKQREVDRIRQQTVEQLYKENGLSAILSLARLTEAAGYIGKVLFESGLPAADIDAIVETTAKSNDAHERDVAHGLIVSIFRDRKEPWAADLVHRAHSENWGEDALMTILRALPVSRWTWNQVAALGSEIEVTYWRSAPVFWVSEDSEDIAYAIQMLINVGRARHALPLAGRSDKVTLPSNLLIRLLDEAARQPFADVSDSNEATMFQHYVSEILPVLDEDKNVDRDALAALEWKYLRVLEHSRRPPKVLLQALSEQPALFLQMLSAVFKAHEESGVVEPEPEDHDNAVAVATQAYRLLELWDRIPGTRADQSIDNEALETWIKEARALARAAGRGDIADSRIGNMLSASPIGSDGNWPAESVREALDLFRSKPMIDGFQVGKRNRRGATSRSPRDGGELERREAANYRAWAKAIAFEYPHTAKALDSLAEAYEWEARRHDEDAEQLDWEP